MAHQVSTGAIFNRKLQHRIASLGKHGPAGTCALCLTQLQNYCALCMQGHSVASTCMSGVMPQRRKHHSKYQIRPSNMPTAAASCLQQHHACHACTVEHGHHACHAYDCRTWPDQYLDLYLTCTDTTAAAVQWAMYGVAPCRVTQVTSSACASDALRPATSQPVPINEHARSM